MAALFLAGPLKQLWARWARWPLALLVVAAIVLDTPALGIAIRDHVPPFIGDAMYLSALRHNEIVVVVSTTGNAGMLWQAEANNYMRLAGGYINQAITPHTDLPPQVQALSRATPANVAAFERYVRQDHIGAILLDLHRLPKWVGIFWRIGLHGHKAGGVYIYYTHDCRSCRALNQAGLYSG
jgi:hypothetical protein